MKELGGEMMNRRAAKRIQNTLRIHLFNKRRAIGALEGWERRVLKSLLFLRGRKECDT
jgi:hypothetical protein